MVISALKLNALIATLLLVLLVTTGSACFGPKLFMGVAPGLEGEMRSQLVVIYLHEETGIDCTLVKLKPEQTALEAIIAKQIDLGFSSSPDKTSATLVLHLDDGFNLYSGSRPLNDLQFTTAVRAFNRLQKRLDSSSLKPVHQAIAAGALPAAAVRDFMLNKGWI